MRGMPGATPHDMRSLLVGILLSSTVALGQPADAPPAAPSGSPSTPATPAPGPSTVAVARGNGLSLVVVEDLPDACRDLGRLADSSSENRALSARISLASCLVEQRLKSVVLCDCEQSVIDINAASAQSIALLDEVVQVGDPATKVLALHTKGDLLTSFATRILATVPPPIDANEASITLHDTRLALIRPHVVPWQTTARSAYQELDRIARANPTLAKNAAVLAAVRASRTKLAALQSTGVANR